MLIKRFEEIHREKKESLILISHQERIIRMADKIMVIEDGEVKTIRKDKRMSCPTSVYSRKNVSKCAHGLRRRKELMVKIDETTQQVLEKISGGFVAEGSL